MRNHRFFTPQALKVGEIVVLDQKTAHYVVKVLRLRVGQIIDLFNGDSHNYLAEISQLGKKKLMVVIQSRKPAISESPLSITVVQAISRGERMDQTLQKCTELGATAFQPLITERVEVRLKGERLSSRLTHWQGVIVAACEQSGRAVVPELHPPLQIHEWLASEPGLDETRIALDPRGGLPLAGIEPAEAVALAIGPEGGFTDQEIECMSVRDVSVRQLGARILRTETAAPAAVSLLQTISGDFRAD